VFKVIWNIVYSWLKDFFVILHAFLRAQTAKVLVGWPDNIPGMTKDKR